MKNLIQHTASGREIARLPGGSDPFVPTARSAKGTQPALQDTKITPVLLFGGMWEKDV